jgi:hypothetical protein
MSAHYPKTKVRGCRTLIEETFIAARRPALKSVERDDAGRVFALTRKQVEDDRFQIHGLGIGFPIDPTTINHEIDRSGRTRRFTAGGFWRLR